jgi:hypothetical protein
VKSFMHFFVAVLSVVTISACGKTSSEKAKESADSAITELKTSATELSNMGTPSESWSDEKLTRYEALISSCENSANRIEALDGKDGVVVYGTYSLPQLRSALYTLRGYATKARSDKASAVARAKSAEKMAATRDKYRAHLKAIEDAGTPNATWTTDQLDKYEVEVAGAESTSSELYSQGYADYASYSKFKNAIVEMRRVLKEIRDEKALRPAA